VTAPPITVVIAGGGTGGHLMPALAIARALGERHPDWRIVLVGAARGVEADLLPRRDFPFYLLPAEPIYRKQWWKNVRWPVLAIRLLRRVGQILGTERPALVLGTGGYASGPVVWLAARRGIPTAILEQDAYPGLTTRRLARRVREVYLGAAEARAHLRPGADTVVYHTGSPAAPPDRSRTAAARQRFGFLEGRPVVLITGGSQGALGINRRVAEWIESGGAAGLSVLWATGKGGYAAFAKYHAPPDVQVVDFLDPIADGYAVVDLAVTRAGMMTIAELCLWGIPSILIPLPTAANDHQTSNARAMESAGAAVLLPQASLTAQSLGQTVAGLLADPGRLARLKAQALARAKPHAVEEIVTHLEHLVA
jgi:UDP-N-acetylglucosamine--N-acetylmuramyl-(pentapeptide) pyrophosphoryl-undecaprenol N-acetylglucosamine transferase